MEKSLIFIIIRQAPILKNERLFESIVGYSRNEPDKQRRDDRAVPTKTATITDPTGMYLRLPATILI